MENNREVMKILILNTSELTGGAAVAANRLAKALGKSGVEVSMLVRDRKTDHVKVFSVNNSWISYKLNFFSLHLGTTDNLYL